MRHARYGGCLRWQYKAAADIAVCCPLLSLTSQCHNRQQTPGDWQRWLNDCLVRQLVAGSEFQTLTSGNLIQCLGCRRKRLAESSCVRV